MSLDSMIDAARACEVRLDDDRRTAVLRQVLAEAKRGPAIATALVDGPAPARRRRWLALGAAGLAVAAAAVLAAIALDPGRDERVAEAVPAPLPPDPIVRPHPPDVIGAAAPPPAASTRAVIPPWQLEANRLTGERNIFPDDATKAAIAQSGRQRIHTAVQVCVDATGRVDRASLVGPGTGFAAYDALLIAATRAWTFTPFVLERDPTAVCSAVTFIYRQN